MGKMSDFEIRANNILIGIENVRSRVNDFGYSEDSATNSVSHVMGMFITWLTACEESRQNSLGKTGGFTATVISILPEIDDPNWSTYIMPLPMSTLKDRVKALWGIRIAFTHGDGDVMQISNMTNRQYAIDSATILPGVTLNGNKLEITEAVSHYAIRTLCQIHDQL
jgi:hypothetical protein